MKELIEKIQQAYDAFSAEAALQVEKGNKAAGTRARKASLEVEKLMKDLPAVETPHFKLKGPERCTPLRCAPFFISGICLAFHLGIIFTIWLRHYYRESRYIESDLDFSA